MNGLRNLLQICCLLDDSTAIIKWRAIAKSRAHNGELGSRVERPFGQMNARGENVVYVAVRMGCHVMHHSS